MRLKLDFEIERESYQEVLDALEVLKESVKDDFLSAYEELEHDVDDNYAGNFSYMNYDMEVEL